jgi:Myb-like DNA-binding domain
VHQPVPSHWVPEPMPQDLPTAGHPRPAPLPLPSAFEEEMRLLDEALDMMNSGERGYAGQGGGYAGSCPLPTLLESLLSEGDGSQNSGASHHGHPSSDSLSMEVDTVFGSFGGHQVVQEQPAPRPRSAARSIPTASRTQRGAMERTVRGGAPVGVAHSMPAASSYPYSSEGSRPLRTAARRSLAVTAAALRDYDDGSDSEAEEGPSYADVSVRRGSSSAGKKKHNPWSMEETEALVTGVQMAGLGKWAEIKRLPLPAVTDTLINRSAVDLKDKWRNLVRYIYSVAV